MEEKIRYESKNETNPNPRLLGLGEEIRIEKCNPNPRTERATSETLPVAHLASPPPPPSHGKKGKLRLAEIPPCGQCEK
jgi:hypothetical protein